MGELHQLSGMDSGMLFVETAATPNHIAPLMICDQSTVPGGGTLRLMEIKARLEQALVSAPNFRRKLVRTPFDIDEPYWVDDPAFDLDFHLRHMALPQPGDRRQLAIQTARLLSRPLDSTHPLWEIYVIEGLDRIPDLPAGAFAVLLKIHHAMIDGMGAIALMTAMLDPKPVAPPAAAASNWQPEPGPRTSEMLARGYVRSITRPGRLARRIGGLISANVRERRAIGKVEPVLTSGAMAPKTPLNGQLTPSRVYDWCEYPLAEIKAMRALVPGSTVNDLALAFCTGALRRYLLAKNALPDTNLICAVPVSLRTEATRDRPAGNEVAIISIPLPTTVADPLERLSLISAQMAQKKDPNRAISARALADLSSVIPGTVGGMLSRGLSAIGDRTGRAAANTFVTNVPGITVPMYFCGARVVNMFGGGPVSSNMGVAHIVGSYYDIFNINIIGCRDLLPDIDLYRECVEESVAEYRGLMGTAAAEAGDSTRQAKAKPARPRPATPKLAGKRNQTTPA